MQPVLLVLGIIHLVDDGRVLASLSGPPECWSDLVCPPDYPVCGHGGGPHLCGCSDDIDCRYSPCAEAELFQFCDCLFLRDNLFCDMESHQCKYHPGWVLLKGIYIYTDSCQGCSPDSEAVTVKLRGQKNADFPYGVECTTKPLNHAGSSDFTNRSTAVFNGKDKNGNDDEEEKKMLGSCLDARLNAQLSDGGILEWRGDGKLFPRQKMGVCAEWLDITSFAYTCDLYPIGAEHSASAFPEWVLHKCTRLGYETSCPVGSPIATTSSTATTSTSTAAPTPPPSVDPWYEQPGSVAALVVGIAVGLLFLKLLEWCLRTRAR